MAEKHVDWMFDFPRHGDEDFFVVPDANKFFFPWYVTTFVALPRIPITKGFLWYRTIEGLKLERILDYRSVVRRKARKIRLLELRRPYRPI